MINVGDAHWDAPHFPKMPMLQRHNNLALNTSSECEPQGKHVNGMELHLECYLNEQIVVGRL